MNEIWKPIAGYDGLYEVSDFGRVRSLRHNPTMLLSPWPDGDGYLRIGLWDGDVQRKFALHRLVALAFHGDKRNALHSEVAHLDGDRANPRADNLKWVSKIENRSHRLMHGTDDRGENHASAKLTEAAVRHILASNASRSDMAAAYGVSPWAIDDVRSRKNWKHIV